MSSVALFLWEFVSRRDFIGVYLLALGVSFVWFGLRSSLTREARAFGYRAPEVQGDAASRVGAAWLVIAIAVLVGGLLVLEIP